MFQIARLLAYYDGQQIKIEITHIRSPQSCTQKKEGHLRGEDALNDEEMPDKKKKRKRRHRRTQAR